VSFLASFFTTVASLPVFFPAGAAGFPFAAAFAGAFLGLSTFLGGDFLIFFEATALPFFSGADFAATVFLGEAYLGVVFLATAFLFSTFFAIWF
jgi:hypothetical protein